MKFFLYKSWSVRTYNILRRGDVAITCAEEAIHYGNLCIMRQVRNAGAVTAIELYRGGGLGAYEILHRLNNWQPLGYRKWTIEEVRLFCEQFDRMFHVTD